jgi:hypothetical protein
VRRARPPPHLRRRPRQPYPGKKFQFKPIHKFLSKFARKLEMQVRAAPRE